MPSFPDHSLVDPSIAVLDRCTVQRLLPGGDSSADSLSGPLPTPIWPDSDKPTFEEVVPKNGTDQPSHRSVQVHGALQIKQNF